MAEEPAWKTREKVVTIIERHLDQSAKVCLDVNLPVLKSESGRTRQCDVVIVVGEEPRQTISIVEVQKRGSRPAINDFEGWVVKMQQVGAQHLICVSEAGFPTSIEERADELGPTVRLITLQQLEQGSWPLPPAFCSETLEVVRYDELLGLQMKGQHLFRLDPNARGDERPNPHEKMFRLPSGPLLSATDIVDWHLFSNPKNIHELPRNEQITLGVRFNWDFNKGLQYKDFGGNWVFLESLLIHIKIFIRSELLSWEASTYEQRGWGEIAWVLHASTMLDGRAFDIITPLKRVSPGEYLMGRPIVIGNHDAFLSMAGTGYKAGPYID